MGVKILIATVLCLCFVLILGLFSNGNSGNSGGSLG